ncbi:MAG: 16S rRNA (adenine(1518)-N(6)/adenine(1519)-N(6))-dimethyltransferase [Betaproteobacteria bacterium RIFCSPLOWO2_02_64_14]|nr:MAG: 16S rRNA (adenine(1518)-N(6)/adenine(1519)-N(6))-dimethyltransferase [Betaproteobacteria bacterium RIFCSPLOWO2_02_64_14]
MQHVPRKRFGQHFLADERVIAQIVRAIEPQSDDLLVEIGPGLGALTAPLAARLNQLHVVELDRDIVARLRSDYPEDKLVMHAGDALAFDFSALGSGLRVVGNLPYNISTPILFHLMRHIAAIRDVHVMLQKEVVARIVARPGTPEYGRLSVMLQHHFDVKKILDVTAAAFRPRPKVESAVVRMSPREPTNQCSCDEAVFGEVARAAFSQRRKTLRNALRAYLQADDFAVLGIAPAARAQELRVDDFVRIANHLVARRAAHAQEPRPH